MNTLIEWLTYNTDVFVKVHTSEQGQSIIFVIVRAQQTHNMLFLNVAGNLTKIWRLENDYLESTAVLGDGYSVLCLCSLHHYHLFRVFTGGSQWGVPSGPLACPWGQTRGHFLWLSGSSSFLCFTVLKDLHHSSNLHSLSWSHLRIGQKLRILSPEKAGRGFAYSSGVGVILKLIPGPQAKNAGDRWSSTNTHTHTLPPFLSFDMKKEIKRHPFDTNF